MEGFFIGLWHPYTSAAAILAMTGWGLVLSADYARLQQNLLVYIPACAIGLLLPALGMVVQPDLPLLAFAMLAGMATATAYRFPATAYRLAAAIVGLFLGVQSAPDSGPLGATIVTALGSVVGVSSVLFYIGGGLDWLRTRIKRQWFPVAMRIAGSWTTATSILLAALELRPIR